MLRNQWHIGVKEHHLLFKGIMQLNYSALGFRGVLVFLNFPYFSPERKQTGSFGTTQSEVWIGNFNVKAWKPIENKLNKIWRSLKFCKNSGKWAQPRHFYAMVMFQFAKWLELIPLSSNDEHFDRLTRLWNNRLWAKSMTNVWCKKSGLSFSVSIFPIFSFKELTFCVVFCVGPFTIFS